MQHLLDVLVKNGYLVVFAWVLIAQAGIPLPAIPLLLAAGAVAGLGHLSIAAIVALAVIASLLSDALWFAIGRRRGVRVLRFLCRVSLEPDSCVRKTEGSFARHRLLTLLFGKFVPGLATMAPPLAGMFGMTWTGFLAADAAGAAIWATAFVMPGYLCSDRLEQIADNAALTGTWVLACFAALVVVFLLVKIARRYAFVRRLRINRITPGELKQLMDSGTNPFVVDLRHAIDFDSDPHTVPGALHLTAEEIEARHHEIPRDRDVVLYCT